MGGVSPFFPPFFYAYMSVGYFFFCAVCGFAACLSHCHDDISNYVCIFASHFEREGTRSYGDLSVCPMARMSRRNAYCFGRGFAIVCCPLSLLWLSALLIIRKKIPYKAALSAKTIGIMLLEYNSNKFVVNCDWLQFSVITAEENPELYCPLGYRLEISQGNNVFRNRAILFEETGRKLFTILWSPYSSLLNSRLMTCQFANEVLYMSGLHECYRLLLQVVPCSFNSMGRVDICCDFQCTPTILETIAHLNSGHYYIQGKSEGSAWWHRVLDGNFKVKQIHCLSWGSPNTEIKVKLYHKSRELGLVGGGSDDPDKKMYIVDEWKHADFDIHDVWRLEFSLCGAGQLRYDNKMISIDDVASSAWLVGTFCSLYNKRFVMRVNQGRRRGHKNLDRVVPFLDIPKDGIDLRWAVDESVRPEVSDNVKLLRVLMRNINSPAVMGSCDLFNAYADTLSLLVRQSRLESYFSGRFGCDVDAYLDGLSSSVGSGIVEKIEEPAKFFD